MAGTAKASDDAIVDEFHSLVNMTAHQLETWLKTDESREVGQKKDEGRESTGHTSGRHIVTLLHAKRSDYGDDDRAEMHRIVGYIKRHLAQRPKGDVSETRWAYSLKNWGHDPEKPKR